MMEAPKPRWMEGLPKGWHVYLCSIYGWTASFSFAGDAMSFDATESPMGSVILSVTSSFCEGQDEVLNKTLQGALSDVATRASAAARSALATVRDHKQANKEADFLRFVASVARDVARGLPMLPMPALPRPPQPQPTPTKAEP